ncbi:DUF2917 domain-containing protein [Undibacterium sp.]|uniref:DUF2917 domain-containing protein n=1 Tax=Undibacterium sp. TaxID=1914977 RepID=UPI00374DB05D
MKKINAKDSLTLTAGQLISVSADVMLKLRMDHGRVWVTQEGDEYDYWLQAGDTLILHPLRHIVIEADGQFSRMDVLPCILSERGEHGEHGKGSSLPSDRDTATA